MPIQRLGKALTQKIAAGEVVDRPASVVKELIENSIDAGSSNIDVILVEGGKVSITIRDDGAGMSEEDLHLAIERYTTSKIATEQDLYGIQSLGFRGEALASVAAVSRLRIITKTPLSEMAYELLAEDGDLIGISPAARSAGTTIEVRDLFYNVPVRAKFLGAARTEFLHINRVVQHMALLRPDIGWKVRHGDRDVFSAPRVNTLLDRVAQVHGADVAQSMIPIDMKRDGVEVSGYVSRPDFKRGNRRDQLFVVNGRTISDRGLSFILSSAYRGILRPGSFPIALVFIAVPLDEVDVNIHPRKEEIRFANPRDVQDAVSAALQRGLSSRAIVMPLEGGEQAGSARRSGNWQAASFQQPTDREQRQLGLDLRHEMSLSRTLNEAGKVSIHGDRRVLGQIHNTYLVVDTSEGLDIVDQHIAHERVLYEQLREEWPAGIVRQIFLLPARIEVSFEQASILSAHLDELAEIGLVLDEFGGGTFLVREFPHALSEYQSMRGFQELVEALAEILEAQGDLKEALYDRLLSQLACSAAIKAGESLPLVEAQELVESLMKLENPYTCPHGRPVIISYAKHELDKRFKRA
ncbi:MAG: DNA mismatch repair endonuclease MutL [Candidatus Atribacteria bacterium]|jgi:DNA mismatch repair protein MutL|nr:MAG: DNA mismatch repair endonuclease MutL [Candidatus Atribacteria bacterium]